MIIVVERGFARCPSCIAVAPYVFVETTDRMPRGLRYEVRCRSCGECYREESRPVANLPALVFEPLHWPPDCEPVPARDLRREVRDRLSVVAGRAHSEVSEWGRQVHSQMHGVYESTRMWVTERREARALNQTGGYAGGG